MKNKSALTFYTFLIVCFISILSIGKVSAQENGIYELNNKTFSKSKVSSSNDRVEFYNLSQNLHSTAYINNNAVSKIYGEGKIQRITLGDSKSFSLLNKADYDNVELITITLNSVNDLNNTLDLTSNKNLGKLKYIFIKCYFKCTASQIEKFIISNSNLRIFYKTETPS